MEHAGEEEEEEAEAFDAAEFVDWIQQFDDIPNREFIENVVADLGMHDSVPLEISTLSDQCCVQEEGIHEKILNAPYVMADLLRLGQWRFAVAPRSASCTAAGVPQPAIINVEDETDLHEVFLECFDKQYWREPPRPEAVTKPLVQPIPLFGRSSSSVHLEAADSDSRGPEDAAETPQTGSKATVTPVPPHQNEESRDVNSVDLANDLGANGKDPEPNVCRTLACMCLLFGVPAANPPRAFCCCCRSLTRMAQIHPTMSLRRCSRPEPESNFSLGNHL